MFKGERYTKDEEDKGEEATCSSKEGKEAKAADRDYDCGLQGQLRNANKVREDAEAKASR